MDYLKQFYQGKNVLVTGGAGFIGSHLVEKLVELGAKVTILDNFSTGKLQNLSSVFHQISLIYANIASPYSTLKATTGKDIVFHLAALISVPESIQNPELCKAINIDGTQNILNACVKNNVQTCIFSSSCAVYGNKKDRCKEDDTPIPHSPYAQSKLEGERLCKYFSHNFNLNTACLRYFNVYGERQSAHGAYAAVIAKFTQLLRAKQPITIFGDGTQTRDFVPVQHVVNANLEIGTGFNLTGEIFNIASGKSISLLELVAQLEQELHTKAPNIIFAPARDGDIKHSQAYCEKYKNFLFNKEFY